jgi:hypothetical protein
MAKKRGGPFANAPLGSGERFQACVRKMEARGASNPRALCSYIGRKTYGKAKFQQLAAAGRKRK